MKYFSTLVLSCIVLLCFSGCDNKIQFGGKVVFSDDGSPVTCGTILFSTPTYAAKSKIGPDGSFLLSSQGKNDGLPPGTYSIAITGAEVPSKPAPGVKLPPEQMLYTPLIATKYQTKQTSGLTFTVEKTERDCVIKVDRFKQP